MQETDHDEVATDAMERYRNKSSHGKVMPIVIALAIALVAVTGLLLLEKNKDATTESSNAVSTSESDVSSADAVDSQAAAEGPLDSDTVMVKNAEEVSTYTSEEWEFSFDYPASWGDSIPKEIKGEIGTAVVGTFAKRANVQFAYKNGDFVPYGHGYSCMEAASAFLGSMGTKHVDTTVRSKSIDSEVDGADKEFNIYKVINEPFIDENNIAMNKHYESGGFNGIGACLGFSSTAVAEPSDSSNGLNGVAFSYRERESSLHQIPSSWADEYFVNPSFYYNEAEFNNYVNMVKSTKF